jgi:RNA polymerase sigma-70 factor, ECF subfamily
MWSSSTATSDVGFEHVQAPGGATRIGPNGPVLGTVAAATDAAAQGPERAGRAPARPLVGVQGQGSVDPERDDANARWTAALTQPGAARERAADALYTYLLRAARSEISRRTDTSRLSGAERDDLAHQASADALVSIIRRIPDFRGESKFTTWARSFVIFEVRAKIRQHNRRSLAQGLTCEEWDRIPSPRSDTPEAEAEAVALRQAVMTAMESSLTQRQRHVFLGVVVHGATVDQLATQLGSNRNAIYQLMFHARRNVRRYLAERGFVQGLTSL